MGIQLFVMTSKLYSMPCCRDAGKISIFGGAAMAMATATAALPGMANVSVSAVGVAGFNSPATLQRRIPAAFLRLHYQLHSKPLPNGFMSQGRILSRPRLSCIAANNSASMTMAAMEEGSNGENDGIPTPKVVIDQDSDPDATVVEITFGDRLGALLDTMEALRDLNLNVVKASVSFDDSGKHNKFCITRADTGRKVDSPELLEAIRLTIINNLLAYHPESSNQLAMGEAFGIMPPKKKVDVDIATHINIYDDGPNRSLLCIETADRPGLLVEIVKTIMDVSVDVQSAEFDTEGLLAKAKFHVSYRGSALTKPLQEVLANSLRYFIRRPSTEESSF